MAFLWAITPFCASDGILCSPHEQRALKDREKSELRCGKDESPHGSCDKTCSPSRSDDDGRVLILSYFEAPQ